MAASMSETGAKLDGKGPYPWYDSWWLAKYCEAQMIIRRRRPEALADFVRALAPLQTNPGFRTTLLDQPFDAETLDAVRKVVRSLRPSDLELHEARAFGRFVVHDHPMFLELQRRAVPLVSEAVGEPVEASYSFLSLYSTRGVCAVHLDAPQAKWTFDLCIDQSAPWPIHLSDVRPWPDPDELSRYVGDDWQEKIKGSPSLKFSDLTPRVGQAVVFSGSSQWHYRDPIPSADGSAFCTLLFLHFIPRGRADLLDPHHWAARVGVPELAAL
jgi:hypothetical protein